jgi:mannose-6-phosphate isomerase-like protein (cupin superfamily)
MAVLPAMSRSTVLVLLLAGCASAPPAARCADATPAPAPAPAEQQHEHGAHEHPHGPAVVRHGELETFENNGNSLVGVATKSQGARSYEVWRTSVAVGSATPPHRHDTEEVFIFLQGKGKAVIDGKEFEFEAPATVIAPANVVHQFINTGDVPTDAVVVIGIDSHIWNEQGAEMQLPWRR